MLAISLSTIVALGVIMKTRTPVEYLASALLAGAIVGLVQGMRFQLQERDGKYFARRDILGLGAWGVGIAVTQLAGLASRTGIIEAGQAVSFFGIATTGTLVAARQRELVRVRSTSAAGTTVAAIAPIPIILFGALFQQAEPTPVPPPLTYTGEIRWDDIQDDWLRLGSLSLNGDIAEAEAQGYDFDSEYLGSELTVVFDQATGEVTTDGEFDAAWPLGELDLMFTIAFANFDGEIDEQDQADIAAARAQRGCDVFYHLLFEGGPVVVSDDGSVEIQLTGVYDTSRPVTDCTGLDAGEGISEQFSATPPRMTVHGLGGDSLTGEIRGTWLFPDDSGVDAIRDFVWPFGATVEGAESPGEPSGSATGEGADNDDDSAVATEEAGPGVDGAPSGDDKTNDADGGSGDDEISDDQAAGAAIVGALGAGAVAVTAAAGAGAVGGLGGSGGSGGNGRAPDSSGDGRKREGGVAVADPEGERKIDNIRAAASSRGMDDILDRLNRLGRNPDGSPNNEALDRMREIIRNRVSRQQWEEGSELMQSSAVGDFGRGVQETVASGFDKVGEAGDAMQSPILSVGGRIAGFATRNPVAAGKVAIAVAVPPVGIAIGVTDVATEIYNKATSPGDESMTGAAEELGWIAVREGAAQLVGAAVGHGLGAIGRGLGEGAEQVADQAARQADDVVETIAHQADDVAEAAARSAGETAESVAEGVSRQADDAAEAAMDSLGRQADDAAEAAADSAGRQADDVAEAVTGGQPDRVDDSWLKEAGHGTEVPLDKINQAGWTRQEAEAIQKVAREEGLEVGARATNVDSLKHPTANPKPVDVKGKTVNDLDVQLGARDGDQGLAAMFEPKYPGDDAPQDLLNRYAKRAEEYAALKKKLPELEAKGINWNEQTGLFEDAAGVPYRGDIDLVYIRDAKTGELLTGERYDDAVRKLMASGAKIQHGAEANMVRDITASGGNLEGAMKLHGVLSSNHVVGAETVIETSAAGFRKGMSSSGMFDQLTGGNPLLRGLPMEV